MNAHRKSKFTRAFYSNSDQDILESIRDQPSFSSAATSSSSAAPADNTSRPPLLLAPRNNNTVAGATDSAKSSPRKPSSSTVSPSSSAPSSPVLGPSSPPPVAPVGEGASLVHPQDQSASSSPIPTNGTDGNGKAESDEPKFDFDAGPPWIINHTARGSDTLAGIALRYNMRLSELLALNSFKMSDDIYTNQLIKVIDSKRLKEAEASGEYQAFLTARAKRARGDTPDSRSRSPSLSRPETPSTEPATNEAVAEPAPEPEPEPVAYVFPGMIGSLRMPMSVLPEAMINQVFQEIPVRFKTRKWKLVYSTLEHGVSLNTFYRNANKMQGPTVLIIRTTEGKYLGAFCSETWEIQPKYYGTGETYVFTFWPEYRSFRWSQKNEYFLLASEDSIALGGGGNFAICCDSDFEFGSTGECATFESPQLLPTSDFKIYAFEAWTFELPQRIQCGDTVIPTWIDDRIARRVADLKG